MYTSHNVLSCIKPNAKFSNVTDNLSSVVHNMDKNDVLIVFGGSNDIGSVNSIVNISNSLDYLIDNTYHVQILLLLESCTGGMLCLIMRK